MKRIHFLLTILALLCSCEDTVKDYRYPSVITDYACLITDKSGQPKLLTLDNGDRHSITFTDEYFEAYGGIPAYKNDTTYRVVSIYELDQDNVAHIYSIAQTISIPPTPLKKGETLHQDPAYLQSCWLSGGYLNIVIELKALNGRHGIGFVDTTPEAMKGKEITFYHYSNNDVESYRQKIYASIPLTLLKDELQQGDTLRFSINTYDNGITLREFVM